MTRSEDRRLLLASALPTLAAAIGFCRIFDSWSFLWPLGGAALASHAIAPLTRRLRGAVGDLLHLLVALVVGALVLIPESTTRGVPTAATIHRLRSELASAWTQFSAESAPTPARTGYLVLAFGALWLAGWAADRLVFRYGTPVEAMLPSATIFVFVTLLTGPQYRLICTVGYGASVAVFALTYRVLQRPRARRALVTAGLATIAVTLAASTLLVTTLPGARGAGAVSVRELGRQRSNRTVVSPLVDIRRRLLEQSDARLLQVTAKQPAYWRLMALDDFDGSVWSSSQTFQDAKGRLASTRTDDASTTTLHQRFRIGPLDQPWVPAAYEARSVTDGREHLLWDADSATLIVDRRLASVAGLSYAVESAIPDATPDELRTARGPIPPDVRARDLALPDGFPSEATRLAAAVTQGAQTEYDTARMLQDWFRANFRYSTEIPPGQSSQAIIDFLRGRAGYCEQFAGSYAAMARSLGLPARVVVGFTPGTPESDDPNTYSVYGRNAHAWPEVYLGGSGWVSFEPTPGRGDPQATRHTGVAPQQAGPDETTVPVTTLAPPPATSVPDPATSTPPTSTPAPLPATPPTTTPGAQTGGGPGRAGRVVAVVIIVPLALAGLGAAVVQIRRRRRHRRATTAATHVQVGWGDVVEAAASLGIWPRRTETPREYARRLAGRLPAPNGLGLVRLADVVTTADWAPELVESADAATARADAAGTVTAIRGLLSPTGRLLAAIDPRPPARRAGGGRGGGQSSRLSRSRRRSWPLVR